MAIQELAFYLYLGRDRICQKGLRAGLDIGQFVPGFSFFSMR